MFRKIIYKIVEHTKLYKDLYEAHLELWKQMDTLSASNMDYIIDNKKKDIKIKNLKSELSLFKKYGYTQHTETNSYWTINGKRKKLSTWVKDWKEFENLYYWMKENNYLINESDFPTLVKESVKLSSKIANPNTNYVSDMTEHWFKPMEFVENNFKGDCDDFATFENYFIRCQLYHNDMYEKHDNDIYFAIGAVLTPEGWSLGNHAYNVVKYNRLNYIVESTANNSLRDEWLFELPFPLNYYPSPVYMANKDMVYKDNILLVDKKD